MLVNIKDMLGDAKEKGYGITAPTIWDERSIRASLDAAVECNSPVILDFVKDYGINEVFESGRAAELAEKVKIPVVIQQDHGPSFEDNIWAISAGFQSIAPEREGLSYEELVKDIKDLVRIAHAANVAVEAEVGHVTELGGIEETLPTDPEIAKEFVERTNVDIISVSIGNVHGVYDKKPEFDFNKIKKIRDNTPAPLTIHGGSGISMEDLRKLAESGITKFNMQTYLSKNAIETALKYMEDNKDNPDPWKRMLKYVAEAADQGWKEELMRYIKALKSEGKADNF